MAIDYRTAAALSQNIAGIGDMFMQMNDPATRAKAALVGNQNALLASQVEGQGIENQYRPGLFLAQTRASNGSAASGFANARQSDAQAALAGAQTQNWNGRNDAQRRMQAAALPSPAGNYTLGGDGVVTPETENQIWNNAQGYLTNPGADRNKLPLGMRNNNPLNIVYPSADYAKRVGAIGASANHDAGSSDGKGGKYRQLVFADPVAGMRAASGLIDRKYGSGMKTANQIIAGENGWTGGNFEAAANVARTMGVSPDADLNLSDPATKIRFMKALALQEHGAASALYTDEVYGGASQPAAQNNPIASEADLQRLAINAAIASNSDANDLTTGISRASGLFATTPQGQDSSLVALGNAPANANTAANNINNLNQETLRQGGAMDRTLVENDNKARIAILNAGVGSGSDGGGNGLAPKSFSDAKSAAEMASEISKQAFGVSENDGQLVDDIYNPQRSAYAQSVNNLLLDGHTPMEAKAKADAHHFGGAPAVKTEDGIFSDPSSNFRTAEPIPRQAGAVGGSRMGNALSLGQQLFGGGEQAVAAPAPAATQTVSTSAAAVPQTGVEKSAPKASDEFKRRQSSDEAKAEKSKSANIQKLEGRIKELTGMLKSGKEESNIVSGAYGYSSQARKGSSALSNDNYNARLAELQKLEGELAALKSPAQTASQGGVRRYNPATGTIE
jgi:hypothetical protein